MFKVHDIVACPDGRVGIVSRVAGSTITVKLGADGPFVKVNKPELRFSGGNAKANYCEEIGGRNFFKIPFAKFIKSSEYMTKNYRLRVRGS